MRAPDPPTLGIKHAYIARVGQTKNNMAAKRPHPDAAVTARTRRDSITSKRFHGDEEDAFVDGVHLSEESLTIITDLFKLIDRNSDGKLDIFDFTIDGTYTTTHFKKWTELRQQFDLNGDGQVSLDEFRRGFKKMVLSLGCQIQPGSFKDLTIDKCLRELELHINQQIQELCKQAFHWYRSHS